MTLNGIWWRSSTFGDQKSLLYSFIVITPRPHLSAKKVCFALSERLRIHWLYPLQSSPKTWEKDLSNGKLERESRSSTPRHCYDWLEYLEMSKRHTYKNIQPRYWSGIWHWKLGGEKNERRVAKSEKHQKSSRKGKLQELVNIGNGHYQTNWDERKNKKRVRQKKTSRNQKLQQKSHQSYKHRGSPPFGRYFWA